MKIKKGFIFITLIFFVLLFGLSIPSVATPNVILHVDYPSQENIQQDKLYIEGWLLTDNNDTKLEILFDGKDRTKEINRSEREDVLKAEPSFDRNINQKPGFIGTLDLSNEKDGTHTLTINLVNNDIILATQTKTIFLSKYKSVLHVDYPTKDIKGTNLYIEGWGISDSSNFDIQVSIDNHEITEGIKRVERQDVLNAYKEYNNDINKTPGFEGNIDISSLIDGRHTVTFKIINTITKETMQEQKREFYVSKYNTLLHVDYPRNGESVDEIYMEGWVMSENPNLEVKISIDDIDYSNQIQRVEREDVLKAVEGYGSSDTNKLPGFEGIIDSSNLSYGNHTVKIDIYMPDTNETAITEIRNITLRPKETLLNVDYPKINGNVNSDLYVEGWVMSEETDIQVRVKVNEKDYTSNIERVERTDVWNAIKDYGGKENNLLPGFIGTLDLSDLKDGQNTVRIEILSKEGFLITQDVRNIYLTKYKSTLYMDYPKPNQNYRDTLYIEGWYLSETPDKYVKIYIDSWDVTNQVSFVERNDVLNSVSGYGTKEANPTPGIIGYIDISNIPAQYNYYYDLDIKVMNSVTDEIIARETMKIAINQIPYESGYYGYSGLAALGDGRGSDLYYYKIGNGPNVFFATFSVHGFEDLWNNDGTELTLIAEDLKNHLLKMQDQALSDKWTIYIIPEVNPDGRKYGYTNNGPGRTTLYSWAPNNKGIDLNRSWQVGSYRRYTDNRNYNGTEGFQAYEARFLRDFLYANRSKTGQTVLVDLHGWTQQLIGDPSICSYYKAQFPENSSRTVGQYGDGYLINWARNNLGSSNYSAKAALIELPSAGINGHNSVIQNGFPTRYINATLNMLRNIV